MNTFRRMIHLSQTSQAVLLAAAVAVSSFAAPAAARADGWRHCDTPSGYYPRPSYPRPGGWHPGYNDWNHNGYHAQGAQFNSGYWDNAIAHEYRVGNLSRDEVRKLEHERADINRERARYLSDGYLSHREREDLRDDIQDFRHDFQHQVNDDEYRRRRW